MDSSPIDSSPIDSMGGMRGGKGLREIGCTQTSPRCGESAESLCNPERDVEIAGRRRQIVERGEQKPAFHGWDISWMGYPGGTGESGAPIPDQRESTAAIRRESRRMVRTPPVSWRIVSHLQVTARAISAPNLCVVSSSDLRPRTTLPCDVPAMHLPRGAHACVREGKCLN